MGVGGDGGGDDGARGDGARRAYGDGRKGELKGTSIHWVCFLYHMYLSAASMDLLKHCVGKGVGHPFLPHFTSEVAAAIPALRRRDGSPLVRLRGA